MITNKVLNKNNSNSTDATKYRYDVIPIWLGGKIQLKINVIKKFGIKMLDSYSSVPFMPEPDWPDMSFADMLQTAFNDDHIVDRDDHPALRRLLGGM